MKFITKSIMLLAIALGSFISSSKAQMVPEPSMVGITPINVNPFAGVLQSAPQAQSWIATTDGTLAQFDFSLMSLDGFPIDVIVNVYEGSYELGGPLLIESFPMNILFLTPGTPEVVTIPSLTSPSILNGFVYTVELMPLGSPGFATWVGDQGDPYPLGMQSTGFIPNPSTDLGVVPYYFSSGPGAITTELQSQYCSANFGNLNKGAIYAELVPTATQYEFNITDGGGFDQTYTFGPAGRLRIQDISGLTLNNSYTVKVRPIIAGVTTDYGTGCTITTNTTVALQPQYCGLVTSNLYNKVYSTLAPGATNYSFRFVDGGTTLTQEVGTGGQLRLKDVVGIQLGVTYTVSVAPRIGGTLGSYGSTCTITTVAPTITSALRADLCGLTFSSGNSLLFAQLVNGGTKYQYRLISAVTGDTLFREVGKYGKLKLRDIPGVAFNGDYAVTVRPRVGGTLQTFGASCNVTLAVTRAGSFEALETISVYPQPFANEAILENSEDTPVNVSVMDASGAVVESFDVEANGAATFGQSLTQGMYFIQISNNETVLGSHKLIKQ